MSQRFFHRFRCYRSGLQDCHWFPLQTIGMFWSKPGAENVLALRCIHPNRTLGAFWKDWLNYRLPCNEHLRLAA